MNEPHPPFNIEEVQAKIAECITLSERTSSEGTKLMLLHIAETWENVLKELQGERH